VPITPRQTTAENERVAALLSGQRLAIVRYFLLRIAGDQEPWEWDFGVWHQPTMGVEVVTDQGATFSALWSQYAEWGFGVDLFDAPMRIHLIEEAVDSWVDVSEHPSWASLLGAPVEVSFAWNDFGTGRPPAPEAIKIASTSAAAWIIAAGWERQESKLSIQLGMDDLMVIFNERFIGALGLFDPNRGRERTGGPPTAKS
jgi:hypothetical protein